MAAWQPLAGRAIAHLPDSVSERDGQQIGVWMKKLDMLAPALWILSVVKDSAAMLPSRRS